MTRECPDHSFEPYERRATGVYRKRDVPGGDYVIQGSIEICRQCLMMRLKPDNEKLNTVECHGPVDDVETKKGNP